MDTAPVFTNTKIALWNTRPPNASIAAKLTHLTQQAAQSKTVNNGIQCTRSRNSNLCQKMCCFPVCIDETSSYPRITFVEWATIVRSLWINSLTLRIRTSYASMKRNRTWLAINSIITPWYQLSKETTAKALPCLYIPAFLIYEYMISKIFILTAFEL